MKKISILLQVLLTVLPLSAQTDTGARPAAPVNSATPAENPVPAGAPVPNPSVPLSGQVPGGEVARFNEAQRALNAYIAGLAEKDPAFAQARRESAELTRAAMKAVGSHPGLAELRKARDAAVNKLGNALKTGDKEATKTADEEFRRVNREIEEKAGQLPDLVEMRAKAKAARENFQKLRDQALESSDEGKALKQRVEEARKALSAKSAQPVQPAPGN